MEKLIEIFPLLCGSAFLLAIIAITLAFLLTKDCPHCKGGGRIWKNGVDYICPTCKGTRTVIK